uniref:MutL_C domain-containing protein n=1 Tax=Rhabditophanes sp. KR3021 TaxID=114890 RepID=A0AC35UBJ4_9BILA
MTNIITLPQQVGHEILSELVCVDLRAAIKELIDNSLDAGAKKIVIKIENFGLTSFSVNDDGHGIAEENFPLLGVRSCTSKINTLEDFKNIKTYGFRGEALHALGITSDLSIKTKVEEAITGFNIFFNQSGILDRTEQICMTRGTTITVTNFLCRRPVRRHYHEGRKVKALEEVLGLIQTYVFARIDVRYELSHTQNGKVKSLLTSMGRNCTLKGVMDQVLGGKPPMSQTTTSIVESPISTQYFNHFKLAQIPNLLHYQDEIHFEGVISFVQKGMGCSGKHRFFLYVNGRPMTCLRIGTAVKEVYKRFNPSEFPQMILYITMPPSIIDVNTSALKDVLESKCIEILLAKLCSSLDSMFYQDNESIVLTNNKRKNPYVDNENRGISSFPAAKRPKATSILSNVLDNDISSNQTTLDGIVVVKPREIKCESQSVVQNIPTALEIDENIQTTEPINGMEIDKSSNVIQKSPGEIISTTNDAGKESSEIELNKTAKNVDDAVFKTPTRVATSYQKKNSIPDGENANKCSEVRDEIKIIEEIMVVRRTTRTIRPLKLVKFSKINFTNRLKKVGEEKELEKDKRNFHKQFAKDSIKDHEAELKCEIRKTDFQNMEIIGQFNMGFIFCSLGHNIFVFDQHACDEIYNYEMLIKNTTITSQPLQTPTVLDVGALRENVLQNNIAVFEKCGFRLKIDESREVGSRTLLTALPVVAKCQYETSDLIQMLDNLLNFPNSNCVPKKTKALFASMACRKSVMIGKPLSFRQMRSIVEHLEDLKAPWNCPHGRPTFRFIARHSEDQNK